MTAVSMLRLVTRERAALVGILALAAGLRFQGLSFGLPFAHSRPDEVAVAGPAVMCLVGSCRPQDFIYPSGFIYVLTLAYLAVYGVLRARGVHADLAGFAESRRVDLAPFFMTSRALSAVAGTATVYWVYALGRLLWSPAAGLISAVYLGVSVLHVRDSHFGTTDVAMTALIVLSVLYIQRWHQSPRHQLAMLAGVAGGAAASTKYNGFGVGLPFLVAAGLHLWASRSGQPVRPRTVALAAVGAALAGLAAFLVLSPYIVVDWSRFVRDVTVRGDGLTQPHGVDVGSGWRHHAVVTLPGAFGWPLYLWSVSGALGLLVRRFRQSIVLLSFPIAYAIVIGTLETAFARYALPLLPFLALTAGWLTMTVSHLVSAHVRLAPQPVVAGVITVVLALPSLSQSVLLDRILSRPDTRVVAAGFLMKHAATGDSIYLSGRDYGHTPLRLGSERVAADGRVPDEAGVFPLDPSGVEDLPTWMVLQRSPLTAYSHVPDRIESLVRTRYARVARVPATEPRHRGVYDQQDALYLPLWGLRGVRHIGPTIEIYRRRDVR